VRGGGRDYQAEAGSTDVGRECQVEAGSTRRKQVVLGGGKECQGEAGDASWK
jgi:hypothetical protein